MTHGDYIPPRPAYPPNSAPPPPSSAPPAAGGVAVAPPPPYVPPGARRPRRLWWLWLVIAVVVVIALVLGLVWALNRPSPPDGGIPTSQPEFQGSVTIDAGPSEYWSHGARITGTADDLYVAQAGDGETGPSTLTHFVDGKAVWETEMGEFHPSVPERVGDIVMLPTFAGSGDGESTLTGVDAETGEIVWSITAGAPIRVRKADGRYYFLKDNGADTGPDEVVEFDPETGSEVKTLTADGIREVEDGYATFGAGDSVQYINLDLEPVGQPVEIESGFTPIVQHSSRGWLSVTGGRHQDNGPASVVVLSPTGKEQARCDLTVEDADDIFWYSPSWIDDETVAVGAIDAFEVFEIDGADCTSLWNLEASDDHSIFKTEQDRLMLQIFPTDADGVVERYSPDSEIQFLDWHTGKPFASGEGDLFVDDHGRMVTREGDQIVAKQLDGDRELWRLDASERTEVAVLGSLVMLINDNGDKATIDLYE